MDGDKLVWPVVEYDKLRNFAGYEPRDCTDHRTRTPVRAWCYDCGQWCSPQGPCQGCEAAILRVTGD